MTPYAVHGDCELQSLRTGLGVPPTPFWASCDVVVRRSSYHSCFNDCAE
jgi:hypothetical protein